MNAGIWKMKALIKFLTVGIILGMAAGPGCAGAEDKVHQAARPAGSALGAAQAVPEGVAEGYAHDNTSNPYGR